MQAQLGRPRIVAAHLRGPAGTRTAYGRLSRHVGVPNHVTGMGAIDWNSIFQGGFSFGNQFLKSWEARGVARSGQNPYYNPYQIGVATPGVPQLSPQQLAALTAAGGTTPGSQVSSGLSGAWEQLAGTFGITTGTLTLLALGGGALLFMSPPRRSGK